MSIETAQQEARAEKRRRASSRYRHSCCVYHWKNRKPDSRDLGETLSQVLSVFDECVDYVVAGSEPISLVDEPVGRFWRTGPRQSPTPPNGPAEGRPGDKSWDVVPRTVRSRNGLGSSQTGQTEVVAYRCDRIIRMRDAIHSDEIGCDTQPG